jgi:hypothetical protein
MNFFLPLRNFAITILTYPPRLHRRFPRCMASAVPGIPAKPHRSL